MPTSMGIGLWATQAANGYESKSVRSLVAPPPRMMTMRSGGVGSAQMVCSAAMMLSLRY